MILPDLLSPGLRMVFCGTAASTASARARAYYAGPGNRFWPILHAAGLTPRLLAPAEFGLLTDWGIGLTDVSKTAQGMDREIAAHGRDALPQSRHPCWVARFAEPFYHRDMAIIGCASCGARNRVGAIPRGTPRCAKCKAPLPWVVDATSATFPEETTASVPVLVDFWAAWCGPCRMIAPVLQQLATSNAGHLKVVKVDVEAEPALGAQFGAQSIPLLVVLRDGREVDRIVGALPRVALEARLAPLLAA